MASSDAQRKSVRNLARVLPLSSALIAAPACAVKWEIDPTLSVEQQYTDNVSLAPSGAERSEWATIFTPGVNLNLIGRDWRLTANYGFQVLHRLNEETTRINHQLRMGSIGSIELMPQFLFLDTSSNIAQQNTSALGPQADNNVNTTGNRATIRTFVASPFIRYSFGSDAVGELRYTFTSVSSDAGVTSALSNSTGNRIDARVSSGPAYKLTTWNVAYSREQVVYASDLETTLQQFTANARRLITPTVSLVGTLGYEQNDYATVSTAPRGESWSVGASWRPTVRTDLTATIGKRYFGTTQYFNFSHRMRALAVSLNYNDDITSTRSQLVLPTTGSTADYLDALFLSRYPDPIERQQAVQAFITENGLPSTLIVPVEFFTNQFYVSRTWRGSVGLTGIRHTLLGNFFSTTRESQQAAVAVAGAGDFAASSIIKQKGASATWSWRVTQQDTSNITVGYTRNEFPSIGSEIDLTYLRWVLSHQFGKTMAGVLSFRRSQSESNKGGVGSYTENAATAGVKMSF